MHVRCETTSYCTYMCNASGRTFVASPIMTQTQREIERERSTDTDSEQDGKGKENCDGREIWAGFVETGSRRNALFTPCSSPRVWFKAAEVAGSGHYQKAC